MEMLTFNCKTCGAALQYKDGMQSVACEYCNSVTAVRDRDDTLARIADINSQAAAATYINITLEKVDWSEFALDPGAVTVEELDLLIEKILRVAGDKPETYEMAFNYLHVCITKKLDAIKTGVDELIKEYIQNKNHHAAANRFDSISQSAGDLAGVSAKSLANMEEYCRLAEANGLTGPRLADMQKKAALVKALLSVKIPAAFDDIPEVRAELSKIRAQQIETYRAAGLDAEALYERGVAAYRNGDFDAALEALSKITEFCDAKKYVQKINKRTPVAYTQGFWFNVVGGNVLQYATGGAGFRIKTSDGLFSAKEYAFVEGDASATRGKYITGYKKFWGNTLLCRNGSRGLSLISLTKHKIAIVKGEQAFEGIEKKEFTFYNLINVQNYNNTDNLVCPKALVLVKTPRHDDKQGVKERNKFFEKFAGAMPQEVTFRDDCCDLWELDVSTQTLTLLLQNIDESINGSSEKIYFLKPSVDESVPVRRKEVPAYKYALYAYDKKSGAVSGDIIRGRFTLADELPGGALVFCKYNGNVKDDNFDLILKKPGEEPITVEKNVFKFEGAFNGRILYGVGNSRVKALYSYNIATGNTVEVSKYYKNIAFVLENWVYFQMGSDKLFSLLRKPLDGGDWQLVVPCAEELVDISDYSDDVTDILDFVRNGRVYFKSKGELCSVRLNGTGYSSMVRGFDKVLCVNRAQIFYTAKDDGGNGESLYSMNHCGSMRRKHVLGVYDATTFFGEKIYFTYEAERATGEILKDVQTPKFVKAIDKAMKKYRKAGIDRFNDCYVLGEFDCNTLETRDIANNFAYPSLKEIKMIGKGFKQAQREYKERRQRE